MVIKRIYTVPIYNQTLMVLVSDKMKEADAYLEKKYRVIPVEGSDYLDGYVCELNNEKLGLSMVVVAIKSGADAYTVAHESLHIAIRVLENALITTNVDNSEPCAYLLEAIMKLINKTLVIYIHKRADLKRTKKNKKST
jgi:hypothetical protein